MARMLLVGLRRQQLGKPKQLHKNLPNLNWSVAPAPHTRHQRKVSIGMGNKPMNSIHTIVRIALALGVLGALSLASGADWFFGECFSAFNF